MCLREKDGAVIVNIVLQSRASRDEVVEQQGDCLKVRVTAPPVDNQANTKLCELLAKLLGIGKKQVTVIVGHKARIKQVRVANSTVKEERKKLIPDH